MSYWSRRDVLRLSAGAAAVAVPLTAVSVISGGSSASPPTPAKRLTEAEIKRSGTGRVMLCVHDASRGEVSILQGKREVIVKDHQLVAQVMRAAGVSQDS
ncbi:MAG: twin-arginine translocation signal domain-containing protein [Actinomycetota bacterium]|nr:twin-arginine translocation signal domain-containing protein [Actinomycetota bacterium]